MAAGLSHWQLGKFDLYHVNPPLVRMVAAVPVLWADPKIDWSQYSDAPGRARSSPSAATSSATTANARSGFSPGRAGPASRSACSGGYVCFRWARELYGDWSGLLALTLWCFEPNILANGQLITPDMGATALGVTAGYCFWKWLKQPRLAACRPRRGGVGAGGTDQNDLDPPVRPLADAVAHLEAARMAPDARPLLAGAGPSTGSDACLSHFISSTRLTASRDAFTRLGQLPVRERKPGRPAGGAVGAGRQPLRRHLAGYAAGPGPAELPAGHRRAEARLRVALQFLPARRVAQAGLVVLLPVRADDQGSAGRLAAGVAGGVPRPDPARLRRPLARRDRRAGAGGRGAGVRQFADGLQPPFALRLADLSVSVRLDEQGGAGVREEGTRGGVARRRRPWPGPW